MRHEKRAVSVNGRRMAYHASGLHDGPPIVFLHGNPTSSFVWRNVTPHVEAYGRCIAPDLIGMGDSEKLEGEGDDRYRFAVHVEFVEGFLEAVGALSDVTFVLHDWGSALGFDWASRHPQNVSGLAYAEAFCGPLSLDDWPESGRDIFTAMRGGAGEDLVLQKNAFIERVLPASVLRDLTDEEMAAYRRPFPEPGEGRRPMLTWPREIPFDGEPADVAAVVERYSRWLAETDTPKLYIHAEPGFLSTVYADRCRSWPNQQEVRVAGIHFVQEDRAPDIGRALAAWLVSSRPSEP